MTTLVAIPAGHFNGQQAITHKPSTIDTRSLEDLIRETQVEVNANQVMATANQAAIAADVWDKSVVTDDQRTAATEDRTAFIAPSAGEVTYVAAFNGETAASGEDMSVDVTIGGTTCLTGAIALAAAQTTAVVAGTLAAAVAFSAGDKVVIARTYTAGGGATPITGNSVSVGIRLTK